MAIINVIINYIQKFAVESEVIYHINPTIFCIIFFGSGVPLYYGFYLIWRSAVKFEGRKLKRKKIDHKELKAGVVISAIGWCLPYLYVMFFGKLPLKLWIVFILFILVTGTLFIRTLRNKVLEAEEIAEEIVEETIEETADE